MQNTSLNQDKMKDMLDFLLWLMTSYSFQRFLKNCSKSSYICVKVAHTLWPFLSLVSESRQKTHRFLATGLIVYAMLFHCIHSLLFKIVKQALYM